MLNIKTKIIATLGPVSSNKRAIQSLVKAGVNIFRINFSHASYDEIRQRLNIIRDLEKELKIDIPVMADLQGPKIRLNAFENEIPLKKGQTIELGITDNINVDKKKPYIVYKPLSKHIKAGDRIFIDDGLVSLSVTNVGKSKLQCTVLNGKVLKPRKGVNLPDTHLKTKILTEKDLKDLEFILKESFDFIALSFVQTEKDVQELRKILDAHKSKIQIIAKIEKPKALERLDEIIKASDAILVARGDLGVEISLEKVPAVQDIIVKKCRYYRKPVIIATQMLESMTQNPRPTRAEVTDVYHAVKTATDAVMLSGETAVGKHIVEVINVMKHIIIQAEKDIPKIDAIKLTIPENIDNAIAFMGAQLTERLNARFVCVFTYSGLSARLVSKSLFHYPIIAFCMSKQVERQLKLVRGVNLTFVEKRTTNLDELFEYANLTLLKEKLVKKGDKIVIVTGQPLGKSGSTNILKVHTIK